MDGYLLGGTAPMPELCDTLGESQPHHRHLPVVSPSQSLPLPSGLAFPNYKVAQKLSDSDSSFWGIRLK